MGLTLCAARKNGSHSNRLTCPGSTGAGSKTRAIGWLTHGLIFSQPLFFIEYGISLLGALQICRSALLDQPAAVAAYRRALALPGSDASLSALYASAGARFAIDRETLADNLAWVEQRLAYLYASPGTHHSSQID